MTKEYMKIVQCKYAPVKCKFHYNEIHFIPVKIVIMNAGYDTFLPSVSAVKCHSLTPKYHQILESPLRYGRHTERMVIVCEAGGENSLIRLLIMAIKASHIWTLLSYLPDYLTVEKGVLHQKERGCNSGLRI
ncbi:hypothetical protein STEG23_033906 [Scotinomys teguina]